MRKRIPFLLLLVVLISALPLQAIFGDIHGPYANTDYGAAPFPFDDLNRKIVVANGRIFQFGVKDGTDTFGYWHSEESDPGTFSAFQPIRVIAEEPANTAVDTNGTHIAYAVIEDGYDKVLYRLGTPNADGSITWSATEQTVYSGGGNTCAYPTIVFDGNDQNWIGWCQSPWATGTVLLTTTTTMNGTWTDASGYPEWGWGGDYHEWHHATAATTDPNGNVIILQAITTDDHSGALNRILWHNATDTYWESDLMPDSQWQECVELVADPDGVDRAFLGYTTTSNVMRAMTYYGYDGFDPLWTTPETIQTGIRSGSGDQPPTLSIDSLGNGFIIYLKNLAQINYAICATGQNSWSDYYPFYTDTINTKYMWFQTSTRFAWNNRVWYIKGRDTSSPYSYAMFYIDTNGSTVPQWDAVGYNQTMIGAPNEMYSHWTVPLGGTDSYIFGWNASGSWVNDTAAALVDGWANVTKTNPSTIGQIVGYQFWANSTSGEWNTTGIQTFEVGYPYYINISLPDTEISGMEGCGAWVFVGVTEYAFTIAADTYHPQNATLGLGFYDGSGRFFSMLYESEQADYQYDPTTYTIYDDALTIVLGDVISIGNTSLSVTWNVKFNTPIYDVINSSLWTLVRIDDRVSGSWNETYPNYFSIYNLGGLTEYSFTGTGGHTTGGDAFELYAGGAYTGHIRFSDDFESGTLLPHWVEIVEYEDENSNNEVNITDFPSRDLYSLMVTDGAVGVPTPYGTCEWDMDITSGIVTAQFYLRTSDVTGSYGQVTITDSGGNQIVRIYMGNSTDYNGWSADDVSLTTYIGVDFVPATWYNVTAVLNVTSETFDVYIAGVLRANDFGFTSSNNPRRIKFEYIHAGTFGSMFVDDILVTVPFIGGNAGTAEAVVYYRNLQNYHAKFSVFLEGCDGVLDDDVVSTYFIETTIEYCYGDEWYNWTGRIEQVDGKATGKDQYVQFNVTWYENAPAWGGTAVRAAAPYSFWEGYQGANDQFTIWVDLWFNKLNFSSIYGGRISAAYWGVHDSSNPWLRWWSGNDWGPIGEETPKSDFFKDIQLPNGTIISSRDIKMMRVRVAVNRTADYDYMVVLRGFDIQDFKYAPSHDIMQGVDTPIFNKPEMPQLPGSGFLAALGNAFAAVGRFLWNGFVLVWQRLSEAIWTSMTAIWNWLMPFISNSWNGLITWLGTLPYIGTVIGWLTNAWTYASALFTGLMTSIAFGWDMFWAIISGFFVFWEQIWTVLDLIVNEYGDFLPLMVMVGIIELFREGFEEGNWTPMIDTLRLLFGIMSFFMNWGMRLVEFMADRLIGGLPI